MIAAAAAFTHRHAAHCESGVASSLFTHHGVPLSEAAAFGLAGALSFAYLPFIRIDGFPLVAYRMPPRAILNGVRRALGARLRFQTFADPERGRQRLDELLAQGRVVGAQTSVYWLPYFPPEMRFHFNAHNLIVYGKEGGEYLISDPVAEMPVRCAEPDLARARFARGLLAPKGLLYTLEQAPQRAAAPDTWRRAIRTVARRMTAPVPIVGVRGMRLLARRIARLSAGAEETPRFVGHLVRMQEEIGTGGAGFRFLYAAFLQEAAEAAERPALAARADELLAIGDTWRAFALRAARMIRGREPMAPPALAELLVQISQREQAFFAGLLGDV